MRNILGISGSLRKGSFNTGLLLAAQELAPAGMTIRVYASLGEIPPYNQDTETAGAPPSVVELKELVRAADGLLIATPEYNYSVPGVLKNAIDWLSRPPAQTPLKRKPVGIIGASGGASGTIRAQLALRQSFVFTETLAMLRPEYLLAAATGKFDASGRLVEEASREKLAAFLTAFDAWIGLVGGA